MKNEMLIEEMLPSEANVIVETVSGGKDTYLHGTFMQANVKNRNGRMYPLVEITAAVESACKHISEHKGIMGELDHPQSLSINLDRVSHVITEMYMDGENAIGRAKLLNTPMGNIAKELINSGVRLGVSSRGAGTVNESGNVERFNLLTVDIVATPSAPGAVPNAVYESMEHSINGRKIITLAEQMQNDEAAQKYFKKAIMKFITDDLFGSKK